MTSFYENLILLILNPLQRLQIRIYFLRKPMKIQICVIRHCTNVLSILCCTCPLELGQILHMLLDVYPNIVLYQLYSIRMQLSEYFGIYKELNHMVCYLIVIAQLTVTGTLMLIGVVTEMTESRLQIIAFTSGMH